MDACQNNKNVNNSSISDVELLKTFSIAKLHLSTLLEEPTLMGIKHFLYEQGMPYLHVGVEVV